MQNQILRIEHLSHKYHNGWAIEDINIEITQTGIMGLLGSNGAGKSTTMNIMCGVINPTLGKVYIDGIDIQTDPENAKQRIGFLPQAPPLYVDLTVDEYLNYCALLRLSHSKNRKKLVAEAKDRCDIMNFSNRLIKNLSGGYKQRVGIAQAILHRPKLVVLDEPTNGLDPNQITEVRKLIKEIAEERAVIFSSHILSEIQVLCQDITMIEGGKVVFAGSMDAFNNYAQPQSMLVHMVNPPQASELLKIQGIHHVEFLTDKQIRLSFKGGPEITERVMAISIQHNYQLREINLDRHSLDEIFKQLSGKSTNKIQ